MIEKAIGKTVPPTGKQLLKDLEFVIQPPKNALLNAKGGLK